MANEVEVYDEAPPLSAVEIRAQVNLIQAVMKEVMVEGQHYGIIPGCGDKPALLKPGAEKLMLTFRMAPDPEMEIMDLGGGHREYRIKCVLRSIKSGRVLGAGVGSASTMETKWRFRSGPKEDTGKPVPKEYWTLRGSDPQKALGMIGGKGHVTMKNEAGAWMIGTQGERVEHDNPADYYNTCLKMAKKRALVDAALTVTAASDIFTQDIEEMVADGVIETKATTAVPATEQPKRQSEAAHSAHVGKPPAEHHSGEVVLISEAQRKRLYAIGKQAGKTDAEVKAHLTLKYGIEHTDQIQREWYEDICAWVQTVTRQPGQEG